MEKHFYEFFFNPKIERKDPMQDPSFLALLLLVSRSSSSSGSNDEVSKRGKRGRARPASYHHARAPQFHRHKQQAASSKQQESRVANDHTKHHDEISVYDYRNYNS